MTYRGPQCQYLQTVPSAPGANLFAQRCKFRSSNNSDSDFVCGFSSLTIKQLAVPSKELECDKVVVG
jgi:hypothetical protein